MGKSGKKKSCPRCGSTDVTLIEEDENQVAYFVCMDCDNTFESVWKQKEKEKDKQRHRDRAEEDLFD